MPKLLVRLRTRPSRDGNSFVYCLDYVDENGKRQRPSLGHADSRKAEQQRAQKERELKMGLVGPHSMKLSTFMRNSLERTGDQIRESTRRGYEADMKDFIKCIGNIDIEKVTPSHGESFRQKCLDNGQSPATVARKIRQVKRFFQLAVERGQLEKNPLKYVRQPKVTRKKVRTYSIEECERMLCSAQEAQGRHPLRWDLLITMALTTGQRKSELLNLVWSDIDFDARTVEVQPKQDTPETWLWLVKDTDRRTLGLTDQVLSLLTALQASCPQGYPYVFVPPARYDRIQELRNSGKWTYSDSRLRVIDNFDDQFNGIRERAGIRQGTFHDLRRTAITNWFRQGLSEHDVMRLAGHAKFETTHQFYLAVADDLVDRARRATDMALGQSLARIWHAPRFDPRNEEGQRAQVLAGQ
ncbi:MAG: tyrosine-type recombinase/integrase [Solirubrobacterales bacterium]